MKTGFALHVIRPPYRLNWQSPRTLLLTTLRNHLINDPFAIGHYYIEIKSEHPNLFGVSHALTGMSRKHKHLSTLSVIQKRLGLGSFFHLFAGQLDQASLAHKKIEIARTQGRLKSIFISLDAPTAELLLAELGEWIRVGGFLFYGGGQDIRSCQGSGCADFGAHFFALARGLEIPQEWIRRVHAPKDLVGNEEAGKRVGLLRILQKGKAWSSQQEGMRYETPDMELTWEWLEKNYPGQTWIELDRAQPTTSVKFSPGPLRSSLSPGEQSAQWKRVALP